jgi:hypothetical protein
VGTFFVTVVDDCVVSKYTGEGKRLCYRNTVAAIAGPVIGIGRCGRQPIKAVDAESSESSVIEQLKLPERNK